MLWLSLFRCEDGTIDVKRKVLNPASNRHPILKLPIIKGDYIAFGETMVQGITVPYGLC